MQDPKAQSETAATAAKDKAEDAADAKAERARLAEEQKSLVRMHKDGVDSYVHPSTVKSHQEAGWIKG